MRDDLKHPSIDAAVSIFKRMGIDPGTRFDSYDQDFEYTSCSLSEIEQYFEIYKGESTNDQEKRLLGCFFLECLNEHVQSNGAVHQLHNEIMALLHGDPEIHEFELEYWADSSDQNKENWWPITEHILKWQNT